jgi:hypothetical protein
MITAHSNDESSSSTSLETYTDEDEINNISPNMENDIMTGIYFKHIYNGIIFAEDHYIPMIEFKIIDDGSQNNIVSSSKSEFESETLTNLITRDIRFNNVKYKCAWFAISCDNDGINNLIGPLHLNLELLKQNGMRVICDEYYPGLNGMMIEALSNDHEDLINTNDIPDWMEIHLIQSIIMGN